VSANPLLATYLNDHLAGAVAATELARRTAGSNRDSPYGEPLAAIAREIEEDRKVLEKLMTRFGVRKDRVKLAASWSAEKLGRLKLNGSLIHYSPLSRLEELELLALGIEGKLSLWRALRQALEADRRLAGIDLEALIKRAQSQRRRVETQRRKAAAEALAES
jgi:hypothetical protein